jgi:hypothetical protein
MDSIDITSSEFSLDNICNYNIISEINDYSIYIYIAAAIVVLAISFLLYKFFINGKQKHVTFQEKLDDCYGDGDVCYR